MPALLVLAGLAATSTALPALECGLCIDDGPTLSGWELRQEQALVSRIQWIDDEVAARSRRPVGPVVLMGSGIVMAGAGVVALVGATFVALAGAGFNPNAAGLIVAVAVMGPLVAPILFIAGVAWNAYWERTHPQHVSDLLRERSMLNEELKSLHDRHDAPREPSTVPFTLLRF
jgi:hypothetical protein